MKRKQGTLIGRGGARDCDWLRVTTAFAFALSLLDSFECLQASDGVMIHLLL